MGFFFFLVPSCHYLPLRDLTKFRESFRESTDVRGTVRVYECSRSLEVLVEYSRAFSRVHCLFCCLSTDPNNNNTTAAATTATHDNNRTTATATHNSSNNRNTEACDRYQRLGATLSFSLQRKQQQLQLKLQRLPV